LVLRMMGGGEVEYERKGGGREGGRKGSELMADLRRLIVALSHIYACQEGQEGKREGGKEGRRERGREAG